TEEEHAVLAQWEQIHENKQDELKAAGIIDRRASTADELNVILMAALIASDLEEKNRQPANEDELRREGLFGQAQFANQVQFREVGSAETREVVSEIYLSLLQHSGSHKATSEDDESGKKLKNIRYIPIYVSEC
ncbi:unnamed protein product, partial [Allacma fusca]